MGTIASSLYEMFFANRGRTDDPNPITGLTTRDTYLIKKSWDTVMKDPTANGVKFFMRLFEIEPKHKLPFPFKDLPTESLPTNRRFQAHVNGVIHSMSSVVNNLYDSELLICILQKLGQSHATRSMDRQALIDVKNALLDIFTFMTSEELKSWTALLDFFIDECIKALVEEQKKLKQ